MGLEYIPGPLPRPKEVSLSGMGRLTPEAPPYRSVRMDPLREYRQEREAANSDVMAEANAATWWACALIVVAMISVWLTF